MHLLHVGRNPSFREWSIWLEDLCFHLPVKEKTNIRLMLLRIATKCIVSYGCKESRVLLGNIGIINLNVFICYVSSVNTHIYFILICIWGKINTYKILVRTLQRKRPLRRIRHRGENSTKINLSELMRRCEQCIKQSRSKV